MWARARLLGGLVHFGVLVLYRERVEGALFVVEVVDEDAGKIGDRDPRGFGVVAARVLTEHAHRFVGTGEGRNHHVVLAVERIDDRRIDTELPECRPEERLLILVMPVELIREVVPRPNELVGAMAVGRAERIERCIEAMQVGVGRRRGSQD